MSKPFSGRRLLFSTLPVALAVFGSLTFSALAQDRFALQPTAQDNLVVFGPKGERVTELKVPTVSQAVTVGSTSFQISYGRDANDVLTAIIAPATSDPSDLHFNVLTKKVDADKSAVVTLTFPDGKRVSVDPGYVGTVSVDSNVLRHRSVSEDVAPRRTPAPRVASAPREASAPVATREVEPAPAPRPMASAPAPRLRPAADPVPRVASADDIEPTPTGDTAGSNNPDQPLFWAEPVTPLHGPAPSIASNEMKLVDVHGSITVTTPDGAEKEGKEGMIVPTGSKVTTDDDSSAAVFMGGVNSARLMPESEATVTQNVSSSVRKTNVNLTKGSVFSRVGRRVGEKQDYTVSTPQGVAAARGTKFATVIVKIGGQPFTLNYVKDSTVVYKDANGNVTSISPNGPDQIAVGGSKDISPAVQKGILLGLLKEVQQFNTQMNAIGNALKNDPGSVSQEDKQYYKQNKDNIGASTVLLIATTGTLINLYGPDFTGPTTTHNGNTTTNSTTSFEGNSVIITDTTTDDTTGQVVKTVTTTTTTNPDGTVTVTVVTTNADGTSSTSTQVSNPRPASGTLNAVLNEFLGPPNLTPH